MRDAAQAALDGGTADVNTTAQTVCPKGVQIKGAV
jgi:hypothetical protein